MQQLIGKWSASPLRGSGVEDKTTIVFLSDGGGWIEYSEHRLLDTFRWRLAPGDKLHINGVTSYASLDKEQSDLQFRDLTFAVDQQTVDGQPGVEVVTFSQPISGKSSSFALVTRQVTREQLPHVDD